MLLVYWPSNGPSDVGSKSPAVCRKSLKFRPTCISLALLLCGEISNLSTISMNDIVENRPIWLVDYSMLSFYSSSVLHCKLQFNSNSTLAYKTETSKTLIMKDYWRLPLLKTGYLTRHFVELSKLLLPERALLVEDRREPLASLRS